MIFLYELKSFVFCFLKGIVICTGENSEFGKVFQMMQQQEVRDLFVVVFFEKKKKTSENILGT